MGNYRLLIKSTAILILCLLILCSLVPVSAQKKQAKPLKAVKPAPSRPAPQIPLQSFRITPPQDLDSRTAPKIEDQPIDVGSDEILKIETGLVQLDVTVVDQTNTPVYD